MNVKVWLPVVATGPPVRSLARIRGYQLPPYAHDIDGTVMAPRLHVDSADPTTSYPGSHVRAQVVPWATVEEVQVPFPPLVGAATSLLQSLGEQDSAGVTRSPREHVEVAEPDTS